MSLAESTQAGQQKRALPRAVEGVASFATPGRLLTAVVLLGAILRFYRFMALSYWLDEGFTIYYARRPWPYVLGLHGQYDQHPPVYYILVKLVSPLVSELVAGRLVSVVAGILTIPVLYAITARLVNRKAAVVAALALAISPLHIWYSQEARAYALVVLLIALSYLSLVSFRQSPRLRWAVLYGLSVLLALYVDYSSIYAFVPQAVLLVLILRTHGRRGLPIWVAGLLAVVAYLPWVPQLLGSASALGTSRESYLGTQPPKVVVSLLSLTGVGGNSAYNSPSWGYFRAAAHPAVWNLGRLAQAIILLGVLLIAVAGIFNLARRARTGLLVTGLLLGAIVVAFLLSQISPGYAERTILTAVLGWCMLIGGAAFGDSFIFTFDRTSVRSGLRIAGLLGVAIVLLGSSITLWAIYRGALKQDWRELAADTAAALSANPGSALVVYPDYALSFLDMYQPRVLDSPHTGIQAPQDLPAVLQAQGNPRMVWFAYMQVPGADNVRRGLESLGYKQVSHKYLPDPLYLDQYSLP